MLDGLTENEGCWGLHIGSVALIHPARRFLYYMTLDKRRYPCLLAPSQAAKRMKENVQRMTQRRNNQPSDI